MIPAGSKLLRGAAGPESLPRSPGGAGGDPSPTPSVSSVADPPAGATSQDGTSTAHATPGCLARISDRKERLLERVQGGFMALGGCIFDHARWFMAASLIVAAVCALSFLFINFETRPDLLYALPASRARSDMAKLTSLYGNFPRVNMVFVVSAHNDSIMSPPVLRKLKALDEYIKHDLRNPASEFHESRSFQDVCYRMRLPDVDMSAVDPEGTAHRDEPECYSTSALDLYRNEQQYGRPLATRQWPYIPNVGANKIVKADLTLTDPHVHRLPSGTARLYNATGFLLLYNTDASDPEALSMSLGWEKALIEFVNKDLKRSAAVFDPALHTAAGVAANGGGPIGGRRRQLAPTGKVTDSAAAAETPGGDWSEFLVFVNAARSWQDELGRSTAFDWRLIRDYIIAYVIIAGYMIVTNHTTDMVKSKSICGFVGSLSALCGFAAGGGMCYWLGLRHTPTMHASPFLVLAIGLDNTFVVLNFYSLAHVYATQPRTRCQMALRDAGLSITITTFTSIISFLVGAAGPYLAVRNFCLITAMGLFGGYVFNIVFFFPMLCLESIAEADNRAFIIAPIVRVLRSVACLRSRRPGSRVAAQRKKDLSLELPLAPCPASSTDALARSLATTHQTEPQSRSNSQLPYKTDRTDRTPPTSPASRPRGEPLRPGGSDDGPSGWEWERPDGGRHRNDSLATRLSGSRSIHEIVSMQWRLARRTEELRKELKRRHLPQPRGSWQNVSLLQGSLFGEERAALEAAEVSVLDTPPELLSPHLLALSAEVALLAQLATAEPPHSVGGWSRKIFFKGLGPLMSRRFAQIAILLACVGYFSWAMYGTVTKLRSGLDLENLTPPDSYLREAFTLSHDKFPIFPYETNLFFTAPAVTRDPMIVKHFLANDYGTRRSAAPKIEDPNGQDDAAFQSSEMASYQASLGEVAWWEPKTMEALIELDDSFRAMRSTQDVLNGLLLFYYENAAKIFVPGTTSEERRQKFHELLFKWLQGGVVGRHVRNQFRYENPDPEDPLGLPKLLGFRTIVFNYNFLNSFAQSRYMVEVRQLCDSRSAEWKKIASSGELRQASSGFTATPFMETFLYFESDVTIFRATVINMATAFVAIVVASSLLMKGFSTAFLVTLMICSVDVGIFGAMGFWGIHLNILSMILLVLSIGFSIDYTVHVVHTFTHCLGRTRSDKVVESMILMANPVTHGAVSTLLGISPIGFRSEFILETFFKMTLLVVAFGFFNGVVFLPAALAIGGPVFSSTKEKTRRLDRHLEDTVQPIASGLLPLPKHPVHD